jgi:tetrahydromethanopterin S-methyltransferase subunit F
MNLPRIPLLLALLALAAPPTARAGDAGDWTFPPDFFKAPRFEVLYEVNRRDVEVTSESPKATRRLDTDVISLRYHSGILPNARLDFGVNAIQTDGSSFRIGFGAGIRYLAYERGPWRVGAFGQIRYAPDVEQTMRLGTNDSASAKFDLAEADAGILVSHRFPLANQTALVPYAGPILSVANLNGSAKDTGNADDDFSASEDWPIGLAGGVGLEFNAANAIRIELRILDAVSASVGAAFVF